MRTLLCFASFLLCVASRAHAFAFSPTRFWQPNIMHMRSRCRGRDGAAQAQATPSDEQQGTTRAGLVRIVGASIAGTLAVNILPCAAARTREELVQLLSDARKQLDPVDKMIDDARWDAIRTIIKTSPLSDVKNVIAELARQSDDEEALLLGLRQDVLDHVQYLDSFSYNNVFVGEERQILGTKIDFDTPRMELRQAREAFDIIMEVLP